MAHSASPFNLMFSTNRGCKRKHGKVSNIRNVQRFQLHWSIGDCTSWNHQSFKDHKANKNNHFELVEQTSYIPPRHGRHGVSKKNMAYPRQWTINVFLEDSSWGTEWTPHGSSFCSSAFGLAVTCYLWLAPIRWQFHQGLPLHIHFYSIHLHIYRLVYTSYKAIQQLNPNKWGTSSIRYVSTGWLGRG